MRHGEDFFTYHNNMLHVEKLNITQNMLSKQIETPFYLYSSASIKAQFDLLKNAISVLPRPDIFYAVKANSNLSIISLLSKLGAGFDVVSSGEILRVLKTKAKADKIIFSGVGKSLKEINIALNENIFCFNIESLPELDVLQQAAKACNKIANIAIRINPDIDIKGNDKISTGRSCDKFGIDPKTALEIYKSHKKYPNINFCGIAIHIGSQINDISMFNHSYSFIRDYAKEVQSCGIDLTHLDVGGGFGVEHTQNPNDLRLSHKNNFAKECFLSALSSSLREYFADFPGKIIFEPGRFIVANTGILVTKILYIKKLEQKNHVIIDAAMNDFIRPTLYGEAHTILPLELRQKKNSLKADIVGPICESGDFLGKDIYLQNASASKYLAIFSAGAYGSVLSSMYNSRALIAEYMVNQESFYCIRKSLSVEQQIENEYIVKLKA